MVGQRYHIPDARRMLKIDDIGRSPVVALLVPFDLVVSALRALDELVSCDGAVVPFPMLPCMISKSKFLKT